MIPSSRDGTLCNLAYRRHAECIGVYVNRRTDYSWMRVVLQSLFDESTADDARAAIRSPNALALLRSDLERRVLIADPHARIPGGELGDNLILALLALRTKFDREEAFEKLEVNIAMRERPTSATGGPG